MIHCPPKSPSPLSLYNYRNSSPTSSSTGGGVVGQCPSPTSVISIHRSYHAIYPQGHDVIICPPALVRAATVTGGGAPWPSASSNHHSRSAFIRQSKANTSKTAAAAATTAPSPSGRKKNYKSEMCRNFLDCGYCRFGSNCDFAHSEAERELHSPRGVVESMVEGDALLWPCSIMVATGSW